MKKRVTCVLLAVLLLVVQMPSVFAVTANGKCGKYVTWTLDDSGTLTISGVGPMEDYKTNTASVDTSSPWCNYFNAISQVVIERDVTRIGNCAFLSCNLSKITVPDSVSEIGNMAFAYCNNLTSVSFTGYISHIGSQAFENCENLTSIVFLGRVDMIRRNAFQGCTKLTDVFYNGPQGEWEGITIGDNNDFLKKATIHYNSSGPRNQPATDPQPVTPTPVEPELESVTLTPNSDISKYSYAFDNTAQAFGYPLRYSFPLERFQFVYGADFAKKMKQIDFGGSAYWSGNCYGMATTAAILTRAGSGVTPSDFRSGATRPGELQVSDINKKLNLTLKKFIESMQISQYSATFAATRKQNRNNLSGILSVMSAFEAGGVGPLVICVYGQDRNGGYSGHALLAYHLDGQRLYVYDCNYPNDGARCITISENDWSYPIFDGMTWGSEYGGEITYIQYDTYFMDWLNCGHLLGDPEQLRQVMFFINAADAVISDSRGNEVATFQHGRMVSGIDAAFPIPQLGITADGTSVARPQIAVWLPYTDEYKVTTKENATVSTLNVSKGVSVNNTTAGHTISVSLSAPTSPQFADVSPGQYFYEPVTWAVGRGITNGTTSTTFSPQNTCSRNHILTFLWRANGTPAASVRNPFTDIDTDKDFGKAALWAYEQGLVSGSQFNGGTPCSRADVVTYLWKLAGRPSAGSNNFVDVPKDADYAAAVSWAVSREITKGTSDTTFNPSGTCTRGQIVTFLYRAYVEN